VPIKVLKTEGLEARYQRTAGISTVLGSQEWVAMKLKVAEGIKPFEILVIEPPPGVSPYWSKTFMAQASKWFKSRNLALDVYTRIKGNEPNGVVCVVGR